LQLHACFQMIKPGKDWILYHLLWVADPGICLTFV
jgi:hypothetical protein